MTPHQGATPRRGWRERIEAGVYRWHAATCPTAVDRRTTRRCSCSYHVKAPGHAPGTTRTVVVQGTITEARAERRRLVAAGRPAAPTKPVQFGTLTEFVADYFRAKAPVLAPSTIKARDEAFRSRIAPQLGHMRLDGLDRQVVEVWLAELIASSSPHAVWKSVSALRAFLKLAVEWGLIPSNPAAGLRLPRTEKPLVQSERVLDEKQLDLLFATAARNPRVETMLRMAGEVGLRRGEVIGLRWPDIDLAARRVTVSRSVWQMRGRQGTTHVVKPPKSGKARTVAISSTLAQRLADWFAVSVVERGGAADGYVWPGRDGEPTGDGTPLQALKRIQEDAGLVDAEGRPLVTFHGLRHTAGSVMLAAGVPLIAVSRQLGHANPNITAAVYAHLVDEDRQLDEAAAVFDRNPTEPVRGTVRSKLADA